MVDIKRILQNDLSILMGRSNSGKTMVLANLIREYKDRYNGDVWVYGLKNLLVDQLGVNQFHSLAELEKIKNSIIIIDEVGVLFQLDNRKMRQQVDTTLRMVNHNSNKILLSGLPSDFKKYICAKTKCFMFKDLTISDLINGSRAKECLTQYTGKEKGTFMLEVPIDKVLCYDDHYYVEDIVYNADFDTKKDNKDLFVENV